MPRRTGWVRRATPSLSKTWAQWVLTVFRKEKLHSDLAIAEAAGDRGENFQLACRDADGLLGGRIGSEGFGAGTKMDDVRLAEQLA